MSADEAAALIRSGEQIGMSGFTGSGYPKALPIARARRIADANFRGQKFRVSVFTGASTGPELDGALAMAGGIHLRLPYHPETRKQEFLCYRSCWAERGEQKWPSKMTTTS